MPVMSHGWPRERRFRIWNTASGELQRWNISPQPQASATSLEDVEVGERLAGRARDLLDQADAALGVDERAFLFAPAGGGQHEVRELRGLGRRVHVLHDEEVEPRQHVAQSRAG